MQRKILNVLSTFLVFKIRIAGINNLRNLPNAYFVKHFGKDSGSFSLPIENVKNLAKEKKVVVIDVRNIRDYESGYRIPESINIPLHEVVHALNYLTDEEFEMKYGVPCPLLDTPIVFICRYGIRSNLAKRSALELGYKEVKFSIISSEI